MLAQGIRVRGTQQPEGRSSPLGWLPLVVLPAAAWMLTQSGPAWLEMWALAFAIFAALKWMTWRRARASTTPNLTRSLAYLLLWPGMDAPLFLGDRRPAQPSASEATVATACLGLGATLLWGVARVIPGQPSLIVGWVGLAGMAFLLHFGAFRAVSIFWRLVGVDTTPLMRAPIAAISVGEFWGKRWNTAFHVLARDLLVAPLRGTIGIRPATLAAFAASGLVHELVISVPARAGFGLPMAYFVLQGLALVLERSSVGHRLGLGCGMRGRLFVIGITALPAVALFHPFFIERVVLPFMRFLGAL